MIMIRNEPTNNKCDICGNGEDCRKITILHEYGGQEIASYVSCVWCRNEMSRYDRMKLVE